ncbi:MAG: hypothetical protein VXY53_00555 [Candidatus Thermoplasmatota archaeon]|nr:hypothetical protein [Candidatus Thermoplasmatota archaeon]
MNSAAIAAYATGRGRKAVLLTLLMVVTSLSPLMLIAPVSAHLTDNETVWPKQASNDTGWVELNAIGADPDIGLSANANWGLEFAPGALLSNVTMEVRVNGSSGLFIEEPVITASDVGINLFDWQGLGVLGSSDSFTGPNPHSGRLSPNSESGAYWTLPAGAEINELIIEALAPVDPAVTFEPVELDIGDYAVHFIDGRMYLAIGNSILIIDYNNDPKIIDIIEFEDTGTITDMEIDTSALTLHVLTDDDFFHAISLIDTSILEPLPKTMSTAATGVMESVQFDQFIIGSDGLVYAANSERISVFDGNSWSDAVTKTTDAKALDIIEVNNILYFSFEGDGVIRWDIATNSQLNTWTTANNLHSNSVTSFYQSGNQLLLASKNSGLARYDWNTGFWLSTWNNNNWLTSNEVFDVALSNNILAILNGDSLQTYNVLSGVFLQTYDLEDFGLVNDGERLLVWPTIGPRSPSSELMLISDGGGDLAMMDLAAANQYQGNLLLASGPTSADMDAVVELNDVVYVVADGIMNRFDILQSRWLSPKSIGDKVNQIITDGNYIYLAGENSGAHKLNANGTILQTWDTTAGLASNSVQRIAVSGNYIITINSNTAISIIDSITNSISVYDSSNQLTSSGLTDVVTYGDIVYIATIDIGLARFDLLNQAFLAPWGSTGINNAENVPLAVFDEVLHMGLPGYGVVRKDLVTGEILLPLTEAGGGNNAGNSNLDFLPSNEIYAMISDGSNLYLGGEDGAVKWDGIQSIDFQGRGGSWVTNPDTFFDFVLLGNDIFVGTDRGVCKYPTNTVRVDDCMNVNDGMPDWATRSVGTDGARIYGGTNDGVGILSVNPFDVIDTWEAGEDTENAPIEVIGDVAYVGLNGIGIARYEISTNSWLPTWTEYSGSPSGNAILDPGNQDVTGLVADINPNQLWIGGEDGFQLIDVTTGAEVYDIEKSNDLYLGNGDPYQMVIYNDVMYYHHGDDSNSIYRIDVANFQELSNIDAGIQLDDNSGPAWGLGLVDGIIMASVASNDGFPDYYDGQGGIAQWDVANDAWGENIEPSGQVDRVTAFESSNGDIWVSWGELRLDLYDSSGNFIDSWNDDDGLDFPIREIVEYNNEVLFATEDGIARYDRVNDAWLSTWQEDNGLPGNSGSEFYELWTNGVDLVLGGGDGQGFQGFQGGAISHWNGSDWNVFTQGGQNGIQNGYPITMSYCGSLLNIGIYNNNGGIEQLDLTTSTIVNTLTQASLGQGEVSGVACDDSTDTLYVTFYEDEEPIRKYDMNSGLFLSDITTQTHNLPSDRIWWDAVDYANGELIVGHGLGQSGTNVIGGGYSVITTTGAITSQVNSNAQGSSVTSFQWSGTGWLLGQAGGSSGYSRVDHLDNQGQNTIQTLPGLVSGQVTTMAGNSTHLWVTTIGENVGFGQSTGAGVLQGERQSDGTIIWQQGWTLPANSQAKDLELVGTNLYIATSPAGLMMLDTVTATLTSINGALHNNMDGIKLVGTDLIIGLQGNEGSSAGVQVYDTVTNTFGNGRLLAGLPSNIVNGVEASADVVYVATNGGVGRWSLQTNDWINPLTTTDGLPSNLIEDLIIDSTNLWVATPLGLAKLDTTNNAVNILTSANGMLGTSSWGLIKTVDSSGNTQIHVSHDGAGSERPGITSIDGTTALVIQTHRFDQLSSNTVTAIASDWWGLHIATDVGPMTHWNGINAQFEDGSAAFQIPSWPIENLVSNGNQLLAIGRDIITIIDATTPSHSVSKVFIVPDVSVTGGAISQDYLWITTDDDGLFGWMNNPQWTPLERFDLRRADPLNMGFNLLNQDITNQTRPGVQIQLATIDEPITLDPDSGSPGVHNILFQGIPLAFTSPVDGAATWAKSNSLKYAVTLNLSDDPQLANTLQSAVDNAVQINGTKYVQLNLRAPANGSLEARITYDYIKLETPVQFTGLVDRPDDGGGTLTASWTLVHDDDFSRYLIYLNEGPFVSTSVDDLADRTIDKAISLHSRLQNEITSANGQPLIDGVEYYAVIVVEYDDGRFGVPSSQIGPAIPTNEIPLSPIWATAGPHEGGEDGQLEIEWARCTSLDLNSTKIYASTSEFSDVLGLSPVSELPLTEGNTTIIQLDAGRPYWIGLTCVDLTNLEDIMNPIVIGPVVPTGGLNDLKPPPRLENVSAIDTPDDDGGRITISWDASTADDCTFYGVWVKLDDGLPSLAVVQSLPESGFSRVVIIDDCSTTSAIIDEYDDQLLIDGQQYLLAVVAYDDWLNVDLIDVDIVTATPLRNSIGTGGTPDRITSVNAFDHPGDDGTAIDVVWTISTVDDFSHYIVWVADQPLTDLSSAWAAFGDDPDKCGCLMIDKQWVDEDRNPIELTISTALYSPPTTMMDITMATPQLIQPDIELFVTVTVHDIKNNVHLTSLPQASVTPINNLVDTEPPERITTLELTDRPSDDGTGLLLNFELSGASDIDRYEVYAATNQFDSVVSGGGGPVNPIVTLDRNPEFPILIEEVAGNMLVIPELEIWVAVVARDSSGNAYLDNLVTVSGKAVNDGFDNSGNYMAPVENLDANWDDDGILVTWSGINNGDVRGYKIYISDTALTKIDTYIEVGEVIASTNFRINNDNFEDLNNQSNWYIAVSPFDDFRTRIDVEPVQVLPPTNIGSEPQIDAKEDTDFTSLLTTPNLIAAGLLLVAVFLLIAIVRTRNTKRMRDKNWELQEATWGIQDDLGWDDTPGFGTSAPATPPPQITSQVENDIYSAAQRIGGNDQYQIPTYQAQQPVLQPQNKALLNELNDDKAAPKPDIDTSFLDDLL